MEDQTAETFTEFDPADYLTSPEAIAVFVTDALETGDAVYITRAMGVAARAKGIMLPLRS